MDYVNDDDNDDDDDDDDDELFLRNGWPTKVIKSISCRVHFQRFSPSQISNTSHAGFKTTLNQRSGLVKWNCAVVRTTTPRPHKDMNPFWGMVFSIFPAFSKCMFYINTCTHVHKLYRPWFQYWIKHRSLHITKDVWLNSNIKLRQYYTSSLCVASW